MSKINITPLEVINFFLEDYICDYSGKSYVRTKSLQVDEIHRLIKIRQELIKKQKNINFRILLLKKNISRKELSAILKVNYTQINWMVNNKILLADKHLIKFCEIFELDFHYVKENFKYVK